MTTRQKALAKLKADYEKKMIKAQKAGDYKTAEDFSMAIMEVERLEEADME